MLFDLVDEVFVDETIPDGMPPASSSRRSRPRHPTTTTPRATAPSALSGPVMEQTVAETESSMPEWQGGFRKGRGARDVTFGVRSVTTKMLELGDTLAFSFVGHAAAFDSISPMATIQSLAECEASRKSIALV